MKSLLLAMVLGLLSVNARAVSPLNDLRCLDSFTFVPMKFTLKDDGVSGPEVIFEGQMVPSIIHALGLGPVTWQTGKKLSLKLSGQPTKTVHATDSLIREYLPIGLTTDSEATYADDKGNRVNKPFTSPTITITKLISASNGESYSIFLNLRHSGKSWSFSKHYDTRACH